MRWLCLLQSVVHSTQVLAAGLTAALTGLRCSRQGEMEGSDLMGYLLRNRIIYIGSRINDEVRSRARLQVPARGWRTGRVCRKGAPASPCARR
jgi:hypothetical protein